MAVRLSLPVALRPSARSRIEPVKVAALFAGVYAVLSGLYIVYSTRFAARLAPSVPVLGELEEAKGLVFVGVTTLATFLVAWRFLLHIRQQQDLIAQQMEALARADRSMLAGMFASAMAHDVRNALMVALAASEEIERLAPRDPQREELVRDLRESLRAIAGWMERLLRFSSEKLAETEEVFDIVDQARSATELCRRHERLTGRDMDLIAPDQPIYVEGVPDLVNRALFNLILNAADATPVGGRIRVSVESRSRSLEGTDVVLTVEDDGPGVPQSEREAILQPFYSSKVGGGGLGLVSFVACAEQHNGSLEIGESALGGARFELRLPSKAA